jgi:hypothetical protein
MMKSLSNLFWVSVSLAMFGMAIRHRNDTSGIVYALLWIAEHIKTTELSYTWTPRGIK